MGVVTACINGLATVLLVTGNRNVADKVTWGFVRGCQENKIINLKLFITSFLRFLTLKFGLVKQ